MGGCPHPISHRAHLGYNNGKIGKSAMKKRLRGLKRATFQLDFDLYRVKVPIRGYPGEFLSVIDLSPQDMSRRSSSSMDSPAWPNPGNIS